MAELLFFMEKLRGLMKKYNHVVQRYYVQYLAQFDALLLNDTIQVHACVIGLQVKTGDKMKILSASENIHLICISNISDDSFLSLQNMYVCPEEESVLLSSIVSTLSALSIKQGNTHTRAR